VVGDADDFFENLNLGRMGGVFSGLLLGLCISTIQEGRPQSISPISVYFSPVTCT